MSLPYITKRKIIRLKKQPDKVEQYILSLPYAFGEKLQMEGIREVFVFYDKVLTVVPAANGVTIESLIAELKQHPECTQFLFKK